MTKYDQLSQTLLQAFMSDTPIEGGVRYHDALKGIALDGTQDSLKYIDRLLTNVRRDVVERSWSEHELGQPDFRNFVLVVAFYAGKVATVQAGGGHWLGRDELVKRYANVNPKSFFQMMALTKEGHPPLFALQNIAARLFGSPDKTFVSPVDGAVAVDSVYWAVRHFVEYGRALGVRSSVQVTSPKKEIELPVQAPTAQMPVGQSPMVSTPITPAAQSSVAQSVAQLTTKTQPQPQKRSQTQATTTVQPAASAQKTANSTSITQKPNTKNSKNALKNPVLDEIKSDLGTLPAISDIRQGDYIKAVTVLEQVELHIKKQMTEKELDRNQVVLEGKIQNAQNQALKLLAEIAKSGNTNAIIRLALCFFEGHGVAQNAEKGASMIRTAADKGDSRAQKLLSKLYYQGVGVNQSIEMGEMWLDKAALAGHPEAKKIKSYMNQVQLMKDDYRTQSEKDKKFMLWLGVSAAVLVVVIWLSVKFL